MNSNNEEYEIDEYAIKEKLDLMDYLEELEKEEIKDEEKIKDVKARIAYLD